MDIRFLTTLKVVEAHKDVWEALYQRSSASPDLSHVWFVTVLKISPRNNNLIVGVVRHCGRIIAIVPLEAAEGRLGFFHHTILNFTFDGWAGKNGVIAIDGVDQLDIIEAVLVALRRERSDWSYCRLKNFLRTTCGRAVGPIRPEPL